MTVYLVHLDRKFGHAQHYIGFSQSLFHLRMRIAHHLRNNGSNFLKHVNNAGISWSVVRVWEGASRSDERRLKNRSSTLYCPICNKDGWYYRGQLKPKQLRMIDA